VKWYRRAAEQGYIPAQVYLGIRYDQGTGVSQDYIKAHMWFNLAAGASTGKEMEDAAERRELVARKMTPQQIAEAQRLASKWKPQQEEDLVRRWLR
jgi:TPR repeat protein